MNNRQQSTIVEDLGLTSYGDVLSYQRELLTKKQDRAPSEGPCTHHLLYCEHKSVYTFGKSAKHENLLAQPGLLKRIQAELYETDRGGDVTYHGPGQLVVYPIFDLNALGIGPKQYIYQLEESVIRCLADFGIIAERLEKATGVWIGQGTENERKICAMGIRISRGISMHGLALNVNTGLSYFKHIHPCGLTDKGVASMKKELGRPIAIKKVKDRLNEKIIQTFELHLCH
jgi:lipoyl(octanoyl) transferase